MIAKWLRDRGEPCLRGPLSTICVADTLAHHLRLSLPGLCDLHDRLLTGEMEKS